MRHYCVVTFDVVRREDGELVVCDCSVDRPVDIPINTPPQAFTEHILDEYIGGLVNGTETLHTEEGPLTDFTSLQFNIISLRQYVVH